MGVVRLEGAKRFDVLRGYRFRLAITSPGDGGSPDGVDSAITDFADSKIPAGFSSVSGLSAEVESVEYREGTDEITMAKYEGLASFGDVTLSKGVDPGGALHAWFRAIHGDMLAVRPGKAQFQSGILVPGVRRNVFVQVYQRGDAPEAPPSRTYFLRNAWPRTFEVGDLDASSSDVLVETMTLAHEGLDVVNLLESVEIATALFGG